MSAGTVQRRHGFDFAGHGYLPDGGSLAYPLRRIVQDGWFPSECWRDAWPVPWRRLWSE